jgi:hypothetical protein
MIKKTAIYTGFAAAGLADTAIFLTSTSYIQLAVAILIYLPLVYIGFKLFPRKDKVYSKAPNTQNIQTVKQNNLIDNTTSQKYKNKKAEISDIDRRAFLKLIGATGLSFFISSLLTKRFESQILGRPEEPGKTFIKDPTGNIISPAEHYPTDNYKISEVDYGINSYYGFMDQAEGWFIMKEDVNAGTYRYIKGDDNFPDNWNNRENLKYDYFNRVFPKT